jgi:hypothetical protein
MVGRIEKPPGSLCCARDDARKDDDTGGCLSTDKASHLVVDRGAVNFDCRFPDG